MRAVPQVAGIEADAFPIEGNEQTRCVGPRRINDLTVCIDAAPENEELVAQVSTPALKVVTVRIGMFGNGQVGRTVLASLRPS
jgi:hypothetical protein